MAQVDTLLTQIARATRSANARERQVDTGFANRIRKVID
jgi:hypothetical protein